MFKEVGRGQTRVCVCMCVYTCIDMHNEARVQGWVSSSVAFHFTFEIGSLTNLELTEFTELASQWVPAFPVLKLQTMWLVKVLKLERQALYWTSHLLGPKNSLAKDSKSVWNRGINLQFYQPGSLEQVIWIQDQPELHSQSASVCLYLSLSLSYTHV